MQSHYYQSNHHVIINPRTYTPSHSSRKFLQENRKWRPIATLRNKFLKKLVLVTVCVSIILYLISFDVNIISTDDYGGTYSWEGPELAECMYNISKRMESRRKHLEKVCQSTGLNKPGNDTLHKPNPWEFLINKQRHLIWCNVFKAASTSWMYNFNILAGYTVGFLQKSKEVPLQLARKKYPRPSLKTLLQAQNFSTTFVIVRHPFERLLSGYRDKIEGALAHTYHQKLNNIIVLHYRKTGFKIPNSGKRAYKNNRATFREFVSYVIDTYKQGQPFDMHWAPIYDFCTPCQIHFDVIMKFETLQEDQNYLIQSTHLEKWIRPQWKNPSKGEKKTSNLIEKYYSQLDTNQLKELYDIYRCFIRDGRWLTPWRYYFIACIFNRYDFLLFNYTLDPYLEYIN